MKKNLMTAILAGGVIALAAGAEAATLAYWNFNAPDNAGLVPAYNSPMTADTGAGSLSWDFVSGTTGIADFTGTTENAQGGDVAGAALSLQGGDSLANNGKSIEIAVSTAGEQDIVVSFAQRGTATGFNTHTIEYSTDGTSFTSYGATPYAISTSSTWALQQIDFTSITAVENNANFKVRITFDGAGNDTGNNRIDNLLVESGAAAPTPTPTPPPSTVNYDFDIAVPKSVFTTLSGNADVELDSLAVSADGNTIYTFDSDPGMDGIIKYDVLSGTASVYVTEAQIGAAVSGSGASCSDIVIDSSGVLYAILRSPSSAPFLARIPSQGTVEVIADNTVVLDAEAIAIDEASNRLYVAFTDFFDDAIEKRIAYVAMNAANATSLTTLASEAALTSALGDTDIGISDIAVLQNGNVLVKNAFGTELAAKGDIVQITPSGTISTFADNDDYVAAAGATGSPNTSALDILSDGSVLLISGAGSAGDFIVKGSADGTTWELIATEADIQAAPNIPSNYDIDIQGHGLAAGPGNSFYWVGQTKVSPNTIDAILVGQPVEPQTGSAGWTMYD